MNKPLRGITDDDFQFMVRNKIDILHVLATTRCLRTNKPYNGEATSITIACISKPPKILWWYKNPSNFWALRKDNESGYNKRIKN